MYGITDLTREVERVAREIGHVAEAIKYAADVYVKSQREGRELDDPGPPSFEEQIARIPLGDITSKSGEWDG